MGAHAHRLLEIADRLFRLTIEHQRPAQIAVSRREVWVQVEGSRELTYGLVSLPFGEREISQREIGFLGKKSGTGFYEWDKGRHLGVSQTVVDLVQSV